MSFLSTDKHSQRKDDHLRICLEENPESEVSSGFERIQLPHRALPEIDLSKVDCSAKFLGETSSLPVLISSMTGGSGEGEKINYRLGEFAEEKKIPMGVGSQRLALENRDTKFFTELRKAAPRAVLLANLGAVQLNYGLGVDDCKRAVEDIRANALILHLNPLQEAIQSEGDPNFFHLIEKISHLKKEIDCPLIIKETGCGLDPETVSLLFENGLRIFDIAGMGGSHWGFIEGLRDESQRSLGEIFRNWGIPSAKALMDCSELLEEIDPHCESFVISSGGLRNGLDVVKSLFLGADFAGMALPFLRAAKSGDRALDDFYSSLKKTIQISLFCSGFKSYGKLIDEDRKQRKQFLQQSTSSISSFKNSRREKHARQS